VQIIVGALIPFVAGFQKQLKAVRAADLTLLPALLIAALGVIVVVLEGLQHLNQYQMPTAAPAAPATSATRRNERYPMRGICLRFGIVFSVAADALAA
jgi:hypothetical protein